MHVITHDSPGVGIRDQAQVGKLLLSREIGNVRYPDFLGTGNDHFLRTVPEQIGMFTKAVMAIRRLVIRPFERHQQARHP